MTIYTPPQNDKDKVKLLPEVVTGSVTDLNKEEAQDSPGPRVVKVTYFRRNGRSFYIHLLFALAVLVILACGALGAVVFYRHLHKKVYSGKCGTVYFDTTFHNDLKTPIAQQVVGQKKMDFVEEDIVVMEEDMYEELHTPAFDEVRESYVRHDFMMNFTAIVDHQYKQCFVMKLNRSVIAPPRNLIELLQLTLRSQSYLRRANVIRQDFEVAYVMEDLTPLGRRIAHDCSVYPTHWLEKKVSGVWKRSVETMVEEEQGVAYAMMSNRMDNQMIYKLFIHNLKKKVIIDADGNQVSAAA